MSRNWRLGDPAWSWPDDVDATGTDTVGAFRYLPLINTDEDGSQWTAAKVFVDYGDTAMLADARLIAAAPEMLAVCRAISNDLSLFQFTDGEYRLSEQTANVILQSLRLVIDKAEGKCA